MASSRPGRFLSIALPTLPTDRVTRRLRAAGAGAPDGPLATVATVRSAQRLVAVDRAARRLGLKPDMTLADARAMQPALVAVEADPDGEAGLLAGLADWCRRFTPLAALDPPDGIMLDIAGAAHLFGGEPALLREIEERLGGQGFGVRVAAADTPEAAWALARHAEVRAVPAGAGREELARLFESLPLAALRLDGETVDALRQAGLRFIGDIGLRPRAPIAARFGSDVFARHDALMGLAKSPISPRFEAPLYLVERRFPEGIARREDIDATLLALAGDLGRMLERYGEGARRLEASLFRVDGVVKRIAVGTSRPLRDPAGMARLFRERIARAEAADEDALDAGYGFDVVRLAALAVEPADTPQATFAARDEAPDLADLVDRLGARLGIRRVVRLLPHDTHIPEFAVVAVAAASLPGGGTTFPGTCRERSERKVIREPGHDGRRRRPHPASATKGAFGDLRLLDPGSRDALRSHDPGKGEGEPSPSPPDRPIRLLAHPEIVEAVAAVPDGPPVRFRWRRVMHDVVAVEGPERIAPEWWKVEAAALTRDYFRAEDAQGRRFWLFREGLYGSETPAPRWFLHGLFG